MVSAVPDEAMAMSNPKSSTSRSNVARIERMYERHSLTDRVVVDAAGEESVGQSHGAELEAARRERLAAFADQHLGRPAADVDEDQPLVERRHRLQHAEMDQPGLLQAGDHLDVDLGLLPGPV